MNFLNYLKDLIDKDAPPRISAFLAIVAGGLVGAALVAVLVADIWTGGKFTKEFASALAAAGALATFTKVDRG